MKILVLGRSGTGKTPMAAHLAKALGLPHVRASAWVRERFPGLPSGPSGMGRQELIDAMTRFAIAELNRDPWTCVDDVAPRLGGGAIIEGVRNPFDFVHLHDPRRDATISLEHTASTLAATEFETGLSVIDAYLDWLTRIGLGNGPRLVFRFGHFRRDDPGARAGDTLDDAIDEAIARLRPLITAPQTEVAPRPSRVHARIPPLRRHVRAELLYGMDPARVGQLVPCTAFTISSYPGDAPTFQILLSDGAVFSYVPPDGLVDPDRRAPPELPLDELVYHNCPDEKLCVHRFDALSGPVLALFKKRDLWLGGEYLFTIEWWTGNQLLHAVALDNGQLALLPHHKLKFGSGHAPGFEPYKKLRRSWRVPDEE